MRVMWRMVVMAAVGISTVPTGEALRELEMVYSHFMLITAESLEITISMWMVPTG